VLGYDVTYWVFVLRAHQDGAALVKDRLFSFGCLVLSPLGSLTILSTDDSVKSDAAPYGDDRWHEQQADAGRGLRSISMLESCRVLVVFIQHGPRHSVLSPFISVMGPRAVGPRPPCSASAIWSVLWPIASVMVAQVLAAVATPSAPSVFLPCTKDLLRVVPGRTAPTTSHVSLALALSLSLLNRLVEE
jgi:hypothetical protein